MLDQNTDRMWYVIGAVLIGAAIILIANGSIPQMFASVTDSFEEVTSESIESVEAIELARAYDNPLNIIETSHYTYHKNQKLISGEIVDNTGPNWWSTIGYLPVDGGYTYTFNVPNYVRDPRIAYYMEDKTHIGTRTWAGDHGEVLVTLPDEAAYVLISAGDDSIRPELNSSPISEWTFEKIEESE